MYFDDASIASKYLIKTNYVFKVMEFHPETQTVDIVQDVLEYCNYPDGPYIINNEFGIDVSANILYPDILTEVPVLQLRWGQFEIQCCPKPGDTGVLAVFTNDIRNWVKDGGPSIPNTDNHFMKSSCVFIPFIPNNKNCAQDYPTDNNSLVIKSANAKITLTDDGTTSGVSIEAKTLSVDASDGLSLKGDVSLDGKLTTTKAIEAGGDVSVTGKVTATKNIESDEDVKAGSISLKNHKHTFTGTNVTQVVAGELTVIPGTTSTSGATS